MKKNILSALIVLVFMLMAAIIYEYTPAIVEATGIPEVLFNVFGALLVVFGIGLTQLVRRENNTPKREKHLI